MIQDECVPLIEQKKREGRYTYSHIYLFWTRAVKSIWSERRFPALDGIRAISCIWVSCSHALVNWQAHAPSLFSSVHELWWPISVPSNGDMGVDWFLLLSGFLIGSSIFKKISNNNFSWISFYTRRIFRIAPMFWFTILLTIYMGGIVPCRNVWVRKAFFIENMFVSLQDEMECAPQSWSVGLEMQLYLATPAIIFLSYCIAKFLQRKPNQVVITLCIIIWLLCIWSRFEALSSIIAVDGSIWYTGTQYRCAPYFFGIITSMCLSVNFKPGQEQWKFNKSMKIFCFLLSWIILLFCMYFGGGGPLLGFESPMTLYPFPYNAAKLHFSLGRPLIGWASAFLLWNVLTSSSSCMRTILSSPKWRPFARLSYSAYMIQVVNFALCKHFIPPYNSDVTLGELSDISKVICLYVWMVIYTTLAFALAFPCYLLIEYPGMQFGRCIIQRFLV